jgi:hypothetical protein
MSSDTAMTIQHGRVLAAEAQLFTACGPVYLCGVAEGSDVNPIPPSLT